MFPTASFTLKPMSLDIFISLPQRCITNYVVTGNPDQPLYVLSLLISPDDGKKQTGAEMETVNATHSRIVISSPINRQHDSMRLVYVK